MDRKKAHEINSACTWWYFGKKLGMSEIPRPLPSWTLEEMLEAARIVREEDPPSVVQEDGRRVKRMTCFCADRVLVEIAEIQRGQFSQL